MSAGRFIIVFTDPAAVPGTDPTAQAQLSQNNNSGHLIFCDVVAYSTLLGSGQAGLTGRFSV